MNSLLILLSHLALVVQQDAEPGTHMGFTGRWVHERTGEDKVEVKLDADLYLFETTRAKCTIVVRVSG